MVSQNLASGLLLADGVDRMRMALSLISTPSKYTALSRRHETATTKSQRLQRFGCRERYLLHRNTMATKSMETPEVDNDIPTRTTLWYCVYGLGILTLCVLCLVFWLAAKQRNILYSYDTTVWFQDNPKVFTIMWTHLATILSHCMSFLLYRTLKLMMKQRVREGTSLSLIESL